jgi:hypothetical protein
MRLRCYFLHSLPSKLLEIPYTHAAVRECCQNSHRGVRRDLQRISMIGQVPVAHVVCFSSARSLASLSVCTRIWQLKIRISRAPREWRGVDSDTHLNSGPVT